MQGRDKKSGNNFALDLGNTNTLISNQDHILIDQPSFIAFNENKKIQAVGDGAFRMVGKTHNGLKTIKPLKDGVIADYNSASQLVRELVRKAYMNKWPLFGFNYIVSGIPHATTEVEKRALRDAMAQFRVDKPYLVYEPVAAAIGNGLNITEPDGKLIVDIGGGITEMVVISLSGIVTSKSVKVAGDTFDEDIQEHFRKNYNIGICLNTAEMIKIHVGSALNYLKHPPVPYDVVGKDLITGIPRKVTIGYAEVADILEKSVSQIEQTLFNVLEECPPEVSGDICENGVVLTGGGSLLRGLKERLESRIKLPIYQDDNALHAVSKGLSMILQQPEKYKGVLL